MKIDNGIIFARFINSKVQKNEQIDSNILKPNARTLYYREVQCNNRGSRQIKQNEIKLMRLNMIEIKFSSINCSVIVQRGQIIENKRDDILPTNID